MKCQQGILVEQVPVVARHVFFTLDKSEHVKTALARLAELADGRQTVVGLGLAVLQVVGKRLDKLRVFPAMTSMGIDIPSTQHALWCWLRGDDRGELLYRTKRLQQALAPAFKTVQVTEVFRYLSGHDLTGYEDGTENPVSDAAIEAVYDAQPPLGSYAAIQHWQHNLALFKTFAQQEQDYTIGRRLSDNEELEDAPESAHVKRAAMESFEPEAFVVRRSMPYIDGEQEGLVFLAFGHSLDAFEMQLKRMIGLDDGITDGLFRFSRPVTGGYYWCPPVNGNALDLSFVLGETK